MIDTIVLQSPTLNELDAKKIESISIMRAGVDFEVGEILYRFTTKQLIGTWENSIRVAIKRERWVYIDDFSKKGPYKQDCPPFLEIECSLHKFFLGHNVYGGSDDLQKQVLLLVTFIENQFDITLPYYEEFLVTRIDYARVYMLGEDIGKFFAGFSEVYYPRRKVIKYGREALYFPGTYTTLKLYDKYREFQKHDRKRMSAVLSKEKMLELLNKSKGVLRIELEVKSRKLKSLYDKIPTLKDIKIEDLKAQFNVELKRIFKLGENNMKIYNRANEVEKVLKDKYGSSGNLYLGTWYRLTINGYLQVKKDMPESTFYRHVKALREANVSWNHTDVKIEENNIVEFVFNPLNTDLEIKEDLIFKSA